MSEILKNQIAIVQIDSQLTALKQLKIEIENKIEHILRNRDKTIITLAKNVSFSADFIPGIIIENENAKKKEETADVKNNSKKR